jgi:hypothetical protein
MDMPAGRPVLRALAPVAVLAVAFSFIAGGAGAGANTGSGAKSSSRSVVAAGAARWGAAVTRTKAAAERDLPGGRVLVLREVYTDAVTFIDVGDPGVSIGDYVVFQDPVQDFHSGDALGYMDVQCFVGYSDLCRGSITLTNDGQIEFEGANPSGVKTTRYGITGGTGIYADVRGKLVVTFPTKESARLALHLIGA